MKNIKKLILKIIYDSNGKYYPRRISESYFKNNHLDLYLKINSIDLGRSFQSKLYLIVNEYNKEPTCIMCGSKVRFRKYSEGYSKYCSMRCIGLDKNIQKKREETSMKNIGVKYTLQSKEKREQIKQTNLRKYGVEHPQKLESFKEKAIETNLKKYGVEHHLKLKCQQEKQKQTNLKKYGVENVQQNLEISEKTKITNIKRYGVENPNQTKIVRDKIKESNLEKYGKEYYFLTDEFKKYINTNNPLRKKSIEYWKGKLNALNVKIGDDDFTVFNGCEHHNEYTISKYSLYSRYKNNSKKICTKCYPPDDGVSIKEKEVKDFIRSLNIDFIENDRSVLNGKELDVYISKHNLAIEFNGLYWHSELYVNKNYHLNKTNMCNEQGIQLLHIFEDEWTYKRDVVESIIKSKLGLIDNRIYGRKCVVKEIDNYSCSKFLNNNHIQGAVKTKYKMGLYYNGELVSVMTFQKTRKSISKTENSYELNRFCNKVDTNVIGGASKLLSFFHKKYEPQEIVSFADRRISIGKLYKTLGFDEIHKSKPDYSYFKNNSLIREHRFNYRKDNLRRKGLFVEGKTEHEICLANNYLRIYDCGKCKFIKKYMYT